MNCEGFRAAYLAGEVDDSHLQVCADCRLRLGALDELRERLADPLLWEEPSVGLEERVVASIAPTPTAHHTRRRWQLVAAGVAVVAAGVLLRPTPPDWSITLAATGPGTVTVEGWNTDAGTRMRLDVTGIPPVTEDAFYEIWLTSPDGRSVSAGTFRGPGTVETWVGVRRADHPRVWITLEPNDGDPAPSWEVVFDT